MRVDKKFAPITFTIETEEDKDLILNILSRARQHYLSGRLFFSMKNCSDSFVQKCDYLERQIR